MNTIKSKYNYRYFLGFYLAKVSLLLPVCVGSSFANTANNKIDVSSSDYLIKYFLFLAFVLIFCYLCLWLIKKMKMTSCNNENVIKLIERYHIAPKEKLIMIQVGGENILISSANGDVKFLCKVEDVDIPDASIESTKTSETFMDNLKHYMQIHKGNV